MSNISYGYGSLNINGILKFAKNFTNSNDFYEGALRQVIRSRKAHPGGKPAVSPAFLRPSLLRYQKATQLIQGRQAEEFASAYSYYYDQTSGGTKNEQIYWRRQTWPTQDVPVDLDAGARSMAIGSLVSYWEDIDDGFPSTYMPGGKYGYPAISWVDIPGTTIGNIFKHEAGTSKFDNTVGSDIATTLGAIEIGGVYDPPEREAYTRMFRVYFTSSGGTGTSTGTSGTAGSVTTSSNEFTEAGKFGSASVGQYIVVRGSTNTINNGAFKITSIAGAPNSVTVDAATINQPFITESSLEWELKDGPIGEFFVQSRPWHKYSYPSSSFSVSYGGWNFSYMHQANEGASNEAMIPTSIVFDRGASWWWLSNQYFDDDYGLCRWLNLGPYGYDFVYADADITNMPEGIRYWSDIDIDYDDKLWIAWRQISKSPDGLDSDVTLAKVDPYPDSGSGPDSSSPACLGKYEAQDGLADATGLCSNNPRGIVCDNDNDLTYIFHGAGNRLGTEQDNGGISYTPDGGTTWKRIHKLHTVVGETLTFSNGSANVSNGTSLNTKVAIGDWIRAAGDDRSYEVISVNVTDIQLSIVYQGTSGSKAIQKGALTDDECRVFFSTTYASVSSDALAPAACDYDTDGNIYWIPDGRDRAVKWVPADGKVYTILSSEFPTDGQAWLNDLKYLKVSRFRHWSDIEAHPFHNDIWVSSYNRGICRVPQNQWTNIPGTPTAATKYHHSVSDTWNPDGTPRTIQLTRNTGVHNNASIAVDESAGMVYILCGYNSSYGNECLYNVYSVKNSTDNLLGDLVDNGSPSEPQDSTTPYWLHFLPCVKFDDIGLSHTAWPSMDPTKGLIHHGTNWTSFGWDGNEWRRMYANSLSADIDFDQSGTGPHLANRDTIAVGKGVKRLHEDWQDIYHGLRIRFTQAGGGTAQSNEYIIDESATFACYIGTGKDNISDASYSMDMHFSPTVYRLGTEPIKECQNIWTVDGGADGGWINSTDSQATPNWQRGIAEADAYAGSDDYHPYYTDFINSDYGTTRFDDPTDPQCMISLRLRDINDAEYTSDGIVNSAVGAGTNFKSNGGYTFSSADVGRSIIIEDAVSAGNNHQRVITQFNSGDGSVEVDTVWSATEASMVRWKLREIPVVSYISFVSEYTGDIEALIPRSDWRFYSSRDLGNSWQEVKHSLQFYDGTEGAPLSDYFDDGVFWGNTNQGSNWNNQFSIVADLRDLPESSRRRQYWKVWRKSGELSSEYYRTSCIVLYDENFNIIGRTDNQRFLDAQDEHYVSSLMYLSYRVVRDGGANTIYAYDDGAGDGLTNTLKLNTGSLWEQSGTDGVLTASTNRFSSVTATFTPTDIGKQLRIATATPVDTEQNYYNFVVITGIVDANTVTIDIQLNDANPIAWQLLSFGYSDKVFFDDDLFLAPPQHDYVRNFLPQVLDVPAGDEITLSTRDVPLTSPLTTGVDFAIFSTWPNGWYSVMPGRWGSATPSHTSLSYSRRMGTVYYSDGAEFQEIIAETSGCTSGTDSDADNRVNKVTCPGDITTGIFAVQAGDYIMLNGTKGRRIYEIRSVTLVSGPNTEIVTYYDEIPESGSFNYTILRRRSWMKASLYRFSTIGQEPIT